MEELRKITENVKMIWKLRGTLKRLKIITEDTFEDTATYVMRRHNNLFDKLGPE